MDKITKQALNSLLQEWEKDSNKGYSITVDRAARQLRAALEIAKSEYYTGSR